MSEFKKCLSLLLLWTAITCGISASSMGNVAHAQAASTNPQASSPSAPSMLPSEALDFATNPFATVRSQPDDLTQADLVAVKLGIARADHSCVDLEPTLADLLKTPAELLALARLCNFGRDYGIARQAAEIYLGTQVQDGRESAYFALVQAFLGLNDPASAAIQIFSLQADFPYDAEMQSAADQVILAGALLNDRSNSSVLGLCAEQLGKSFPLLEAGKGLSGKDQSAPPESLFVDAVRCFDIARDLNNPGAPATLARLQSILVLPVWKQGPALQTMQSALARAEMEGGSTPLPTVGGKLVSPVSPMRPVTLALERGTHVLIPFTLWSPEALSITANLHLTEPTQQIDLLTSWAANTGTDQEDDDTLASLRSTAKSLPPHVSLIVVPDRVLRQFQVDTFPIAIVIRNGVVAENQPLLGEAGKRMTILALGANGEGAAAARPATAIHPSP
ncbi:MAG TPA: hypothetical protein VHX11_09140 [Acidobacteriaceae bacterium]|nr:hypothetical protein [Acidobacteriaceae bacterium]